MKSGLLNVCNLNTVLMLVILGLVIYCCVRQQKENFSYGLDYSILPRGKDGRFDPDSSAVAGYPSNVQYSGNGRPTSAASGALTEEEIDKLVEDKLKETQNERYTGEKETRNLLLDQYLYDEEQYILNYINEAGNNAPERETIEAALRGNNDNERANYIGAPEIPNWPVISGLNNITDVKGMNFNPY